MLTNNKQMDKIYLDKAKEKESSVNHFIDCRDGIIECASYINESGYGSKTKLFLCEDLKVERIAIIRLTKGFNNNNWIEESLFFDTNDFNNLRRLIFDGWVKYDFENIKSRPPKYGKYLVHRKDGKVHLETWNGSGWAYNEKAITHWKEVIPPNS